MYAEELCFAPKYVRAKELVDEGALGAVFFVQQGEQHFGPHSDWFWDVRRSGGGVLMDMGCHAVEFFRWILDKPQAESVTAELATSVHGDQTRGEDHADRDCALRGHRDRPRREQLGEARGHRRPRRDPRLERRHLRRPRCAAPP